MTPLEQRYALWLLGGRKGNTLRNHVRALVYGTVAVGAVATPAAMLGYKAITGFTAMISPEWAQSSSRLDAFVNVFSWFTAYGQARTADAMTQGANNLNAMQQIASSSASYTGQASAVAKSSVGLRIVDRVAAYAAREVFGLGVLGVEVMSELSQSTVRGDGNPLVGMTDMDKLGIQASGSVVETIATVVDLGGANNVGLQQMQTYERPPYGADSDGAFIGPKVPYDPPVPVNLTSNLVASISTMLQDAGGVFAAMGDVVLQAADETERLGAVQLATSDPQTQMLARWLKTQHFMQRWLGMMWGVTFDEKHMEFYALVNTLIEDWMIPMEPSATQVADPRNAATGNAVATVAAKDTVPPTSFELQLMVRDELSRTQDDGSLLYPHLQQFKPPVPSRLVQTREASRAAISDTYNGDGKVYAALRAAAYVSFEVLSVVFTDADW